MTTKGETKSLVSPFVVICYHRNLSPGSVRVFDISPYPQGK